LLTGGTGEERASTELSRLVWHELSISFREELDLGEDSLFLEEGGVEEAEDEAIFSE